MPTHSSRGCGVARLRKKTRRDKSIAWEAEIRKKGFPQQSKTFDSKAEAEQWINEIEGKIFKGESVSNTALEKTLISDILEEYIQAHISVDPKTEKVVFDGITQTKAYSVRSLQEMFEGYTVKTLTHAHIKKFIKKLLDTYKTPNVKRKVIHKLYDGGTPKKYAGATVRRYYFDLKTSLEWWAFEHKFNLEDRFQRHTLPPNWEPRERRLEKGEEESLLKACTAMLKAPKYWQWYILLAIETAMRPSELLKLKWGNVFVEDTHRFIVVRPETTKTKQERQVPLSKKALKVLKEIAAQHKTLDSDMRVFDMLPHNEFSAGFKKITTRAGLEDFRAHDLRHEGLSRFFEKNLNLSIMEIALISGHTDLKTLQRYLVLRPQILADKMDT